MTQTIDIAIDLETLSLSPDAAIISIAAVPFARRGYVDPTAPFSLFTPFYCNESGEYTELSIDPFQANINATTCAIHGMDFDKKTVQWWAERDDEAKAALFATPPVSIIEALDNLNIYLEYIKNQIPDCRLRMWAQGGDFDFSVLRSAYRRLLPSVALPWDFRDQRDARTFILETLGLVYDHISDSRKLYDKIPPMETSEEWVKHSALSDARKTAHNVAHCTQLLCRNIYAAHTSATTPKSSE